jgi:hypothetical protein
VSPNILLIVPVVPATELDPPGFYKVTGIIFHTFFLCFKFRYRYLIIVHIFSEIDVGKKDLIV